MVLLELLIMPRFMAARYVPVTKTYAILINKSDGKDSITISQSSHRPHDAVVPGLLESDLYVKKEYLFDDLEPGMKFSGMRALDSYVLFDDGLAQSIINDFQRDSAGCQTLLISCQKGKNRSPALGMALNDIFRLGNDGEILRKKYSEANWFVYDTMMQAATRLGLGLGA